MFDEKFWIAFSFICFVALIFKPLKNIIFRFLDNRIDKIQANLEEAEKLKKEAEEVLQAYKLIHAKAISETTQIIENAEKRIEGMLATAQSQLDRSIEQKKSSSLQKIASYEAEILRNLREQSVNIAVSVVQKILKDRLASKASDPLFYQALGEIDKKLH